MRAPSLRILLIEDHPATLDVLSKLLRGLGQPFSELTPGQITNQIRVKIKNRSGADAAHKALTVEHA